MRRGSTSCSRAGSAPPISASTARPIPACRLAPADHDAALVAEDRPPADRADGRRHHQGRRPVGQRRDAPAADRRADRRQHGGHQEGLREVSELRQRRRPTRSWSTMPTGSTPCSTSPLLREVGRHFSVNRMLTMDSVKLRLERDQPLTFLEFNYMILQSYDFVELHKRHNCILQMGGSDQWGNIVMGVDLGRRMDRRRAVRPDLAADRHRLGRQDGQDRRRRRVAQPRARLSLRFLAVLAQHRGRRCRPLPEALHRAAARRDRPARGA